MFRTIAVAVALVGATSASPLMASEFVERVEGRVSYAGLDLSDSSDIAELKQRVERQAFKLCTRGLNERLWSGPDVRACRASVVASSNIEIARLTDGQSGHHRIALSN